MTEFNLDLACKEALARIHRSNGQRARQAKVRCLANVDRAYGRALVIADFDAFVTESRWNFLPETDKDYWRVAKMQWDLLSA